MINIEFNKILRQHLKVLEEEYKIVVLLNHRNRNQHRVAKWWKFFNILKRKIYDIIKRTCHLLQSQITNENTIIKNVNELYQSVNYFLKKQSKSIYYSFNGVVQLGQFITLGVVLVGVFAKVHNEFTSLHKHLKESQYFTLKNTISSLQDVSMENKYQIKSVANVIDKGFSNPLEEIGEEVILEETPVATTTEAQSEIGTRSVDVNLMAKYTSSFSIPEQQKIEKSNKKNKIDQKPKKKKKKSKNAIDDIFG